MLPPIAVPDAVRQYPLIERFPFLAAIVPGPIPQPISIEVIKDAETLRVLILANPASKDEEKKGIIKFVRELSATDFQDPAGAPPWAQQLFQAMNTRLDDLARDIAGVKDDIVHLRDGANARLDRVQVQLGGVQHALKQLQTFQTNVALSSYGLPLQHLEPMYDANGVPQPLPNGFNASSLAHIEAMNVADLDAALRTFGVNIPRHMNMNKGQKARLLFRRLGGQPSITL